MSLIFTSCLGIAEQQIRETGTNPAPWTAEEQKSLEQSLKTFPANTPDRWDRISESVPTRSKKDCMKRYKVGADGHSNIFMAMCKQTGIIEAFCRLL